ncbi:hypothetical protein Btru_076965 [Bulinus truncatus]|nr:hypothetical protein Btru_076965 [Bulinus truncatus]
MRDKDIYCQEPQIDTDYSKESPSTDQVMTELDVVAETGVGSQKEVPVNENGRSLDEQVVDGVDRVRVDESSFRYDQQNDTSLQKLISQCESSTKKGRAIGERIVLDEELDDSISEYQKLSCRLRVMSCCRYHDNKGPVDSSYQDDEMEQRHNKAK